MFTECFVFFPQKNKTMKTHEKNNFNLYKFIKWHIRLAIIFLISGIFAVLTILRLIFLAAKKGPKVVFKKTKRDLEPACLSDPSLGIHGFLHLEVSDFIH